MHGESFSRNTSVFQIKKEVNSFLVRKSSDIRRAPSPNF